MATCLLASTCMNVNINGKTTKIFKQSNRRFGKFDCRKEEGLNVDNCAKCRNIGVRSLCIYRITLRDIKRTADETILLTVSQIYDLMLLQTSRTS